jgi:outer membrane protein
MDCKPNPLFIRYWLLAAGVVCASLVPITKCYASSSSISQEIVDLIAQQQIVQAFTLASDNQVNYEGEPDFDLAYGLSAKAANNCNLAVYALERVVRQFPQQTMARYALATCYFDLGNLAAANIEFKQLAQQNMSADMHAMVEKYLTAIERKQAQNTAGWHNAIAFGLGQDSNPNNGVENEFIDVPLLGQIKLFEQSRQRSSAVYDINAQFNYIAPLNQTSTWYSSLGASYSGYSQELALSRSNLNAVVGYTTKVGSSDIGARLFYRPLWLDSALFLDYYGVIAQVGQAVFKHSTVGADVTLARLDYSELDELSRDQQWLNLWFETASFSGLSRFSLKLGNEQSQDSVFDFNSRQLLGGSYSFAQQLNECWYYKISADYLKVEHDQPHPLFLTTREDKYVQLVLDLQYQWQANWLLTGQISVVNNHSNLDLYDYKRSNVWLGARYQF